MFQKWYQYKEKNRFNKERIDLRLRRIFLPKLYFDAQKPSKFKQAKRMALPLIAVFIGAFGIAFLSSKSEAPVNPTNALTLNNYSLSLSVDQPNIDLAVDTTPDGAFKVASHNLTLNTNNPQGASVVAKFDDMTLEKTSGSGSIDPVIASMSSPAILEMNSWGIAVANDVSSVSSNMSPSTKYQNNQPDALFATPYELLIYKGNNKTFPVYYGVNINNTKAEGVYAQTVTYTAYALSSANPKDNIEVAPNIIASPTATTNITVKTSIKTSRAITSNDIRVYIKNSNCTSINIVQNYPNNLEFVCNAPTRSAVGGVGKKQVRLRIPDNDNFIQVDNAIEYIDAAPMQSFTKTDCDNMTQHQVKYLKDTRDNEVYTVSKLKDNKCWMTQNLRLKLNTSTTLTPANTDISSNWTPNRSTEVSNGTGGNNNQGSGAVWKNDSEGYKTVRSIYRTPTYNTHGVYYTHSAATAQSANNIDTSGQNAPHSICPKGWRLPTSSNNYGQGEFWQLADKYKGSATWQNNNYYLNGSHTLMQAPASFPLSGYYDYDGYFGLVGSHGRWWSSTVYGSSYAYGLNQASSGLLPHHTWSRYYGLSVRCVLKDLTMQDFTEQDCNNMTEHQTKTLTDSRDGEKYTVAKLKDGRCWMTQNLRLKLNTSTTLTPANTDVSSNWTPNRSSEEGTSGVWNNDPEGYKTVRSKYQNSTYSTNGVYYTHSAATAQSANNIDTQGQNAPHSICPKGWRLPTSSNNYGQGEFWQLADKHKGSATWQDNNRYLNGSHTLMQAPASFPLSGFYDYDGYFNNVGSSGFWWSSTINVSNYAYLLYQNSFSLGPHDDWYRYNGLSVRCVAR